jgi:hypothetical protein
VREGFYLIRDNKVVLCEESGAVAYGSPERELGPGQNAEYLAKTMLRARAPKSNFSGPIKMPPMGIA